MIGFCRLRNDYRHFRVDRIKTFEVSHLRFEGVHPGLERFLEKTKVEKQLTKVVIRVDKSEYYILGNEPYYHGLVSERKLESQIKMEFFTSSLAGFAHWLLMVGHAIDIEEPSELKTMVKERLFSVENRLKN